MPSVISTVILPGLGFVCPECFSRGFIGDLALDGHEVYSFSMTSPDSELSWDIARARELLTQRPRKPKKLDPVELADWLASRVTITPSHLDHIPAGKRGLPGIFVVITVAAKPDAPMFDFGILIDGSHRAALALRDGRDFSAYLLTEQEQRSICTYTVEGRVTEIPLIAPGPGITPEDAGL
jgi:hypothetical protein